MLPDGSPAWHKTYATLRNTTEGLNGYAKDPAHQALAEQPAPLRPRIAAQPVFTALLLMAANIRKIRAWRDLFDQATQRPGPLSDPGAILKKQATATILSVRHRQFCRNPRRRIGDLNPGGP